MQLILRSPLVLEAADHQQGGYHQCQRNRQHNPGILNKARQNISHKGHTGNNQCISQLGIDMGNVIAVSTCRGHNGGIGNGRAVVAADCTGQAGSHGNHHQFAAGENSANDGQQHTEGAPGGTGGEGQEAANDKDDGRQEVCQVASSTANQFRHEDLGSQLVGHTGQSPGKNQDQDGRNHSPEAVHEGIGKLVEGNDLPGNIQQEGRCQCKEGSQNQAHGSITAGKGIHEIHVNTAVLVKETAGVDHGKHTRNNQRHDGQNQIHHRSLAVFRSGSIFILRVAEAQRSIVLGSLHLAKIQAHPGHENNGKQRQQGVQIVGNGADEQAQAFSLRSNGGNGCCPGRNGGNDTDRSGGSIDDICQLFPGNFELVGDGPHHRANSQTVEVVINEDQHAQNTGGDQGAALVLDPLGCPTAVGSRTAGLVDHGDHHSQQNQENQNAHVPAVADLGDHHIKGIQHHIPQTPVCVDQGACQNAHKQGGVDLLGQQGQSNGNHGRQQSHQGAIAAYRLSGSFQSGMDVFVKILVGAHVVRIAIQISKGIFPAELGCGSRERHSANQHCQSQQQGQPFGHSSHFFRPFGNDKQKTVNPGVTPHSRQHI